MKTVKYLTAITLIIMLSACGQRYAGFEKSKTGLYYQFHSQNPSSVMPEKGGIVDLCMSIRTENDSVIMPEKSITTMMETPKFEGDLFDALSMMHCGDSATFIINAEQYFNAYQYGYVPSFVNDKTMLWFTIKINNIFSYEEYQQFSMQKAKDEERKQISDYLVANHIEETPTESGLIVIKHNTTAGKPAKNGSRCSVHYTGKLLNGEVFDSSVERGTPFDFTLGAGEVIKGWDEGIALLRKGEKATLIIPSELGYGVNGAGGGSIPPYASLVFDVELVDVK